MALWPCWFKSSPGHLIQETAGSEASSRFLYTKAMQSKRDYSYGVIPTRQTETGETEFLLIYQYSPVGNDHYWIFPKGHAEAGETPLESAARELQEETGLLAQIQSEPVFKLHYDFLVDEVRIDKEVQFFLGVVTDVSTLQLQEDEVSEAVWLPYQTARERLSKENSRLLLDEVQTHLQTTGV